MRLEKQILVGFIGGMAVGGATRIAGMEGVQRGVIALEPVGTAFIRLITMVVVPLVIASVFVGVASLGNVRTLGRVGGKALAYFLGTTLAAALVGLAVALLTHVGEGLSAVDRDALIGRLGDQT